MNFDPYLSKRGLQCFKSRSGFFCDLLDESLMHPGVISVGQQQKLTHEYIASHRLTDVT